MSKEKASNNEGVQIEQKTSWKQFFNFFLKVKLSWPLIILAMIVSIAYYEVVAHVPGSTAKLFSGDFSRAALMGVLINYGSMLVLNVVISLISVYAQAKSLRSVRNTVWKRMMHVSTKYYTENDPSYLLSAITNDAKAAVESIITILTSFLPMMYYVVRSFTMVRGYSIKLMLSLFILIPIYILYGIFVGRWQCKTNKRIQTRIGGLTGYLTERLRNLNLIKAFSNEKVEEENGTNTVRRLYKAKLNSTYINTSVVGYVLLSDVIATVIAVMWGAALLRNQEITVEAWMAFFIFVPTINGQLRSIVMMWIQAKGMQGYAARLSSIMDAPQEMEKIVGTENAAFTNGNISFKNVSFAYGDKDVLKNINLTIPKGKSTAIIGLSGCGKTTMLSLMERFYEPKSGSITVGETPIQSFDIKDYRQRFAYVQQDAGIFSGTVRHVITYGVNHQVTDKEIEEAAKLTGIYDYISKLPDKFNTQMSLWGNSLSGGQRQRLVIARELIKNADILLFDEPTSALDASTTRELQDTILRVFKGKTIVTITHDLSLIASVDQIAVVNNGVVEACGTNSELMEKSQLYRELVEEQSYQEAFAL